MPLEDAVFVFYCCITDCHKFSAQTNTCLLTDIFMGQESRPQVRSGSHEPEVEGPPGLHSHLELEVLF